MVDVGFVIRLNRTGLFPVWEKAKRHNSFDLWPGPDDLSVFCVQHSMACGNRRRADCDTLVCQNLKIHQSKHVMRQMFEPRHFFAIARYLRTLAISLVLLGVVACSGLDPMSCGAGQAPHVSETLYFGTGTADGRVTQVQWQAFIDDVITPRFPQGLSIWPAYGQWQTAAGPVIREDSYVLNVVHEGEPSSERAIAEIMNSYKQRFRQEAVLRVTSAVCVSF